MAVISKAGKRDVAFPIGFKLVTIITILLLVSLGAITALVSVFVGADVERTAEENNFSVNQRSAAETELALGMIRSNTLALLDTLDALGRVRDFGAVDTALGSFFERNGDMAAIVPLDGGEPLINEAFFRNNEAESGDVLEYAAAQTEAANRARGGELVIQNASLALGIPALVMFCPRGNGAAAIFFSSDALGEIYGTGTNVSFLVNDSADLLIHADSGLTAAAANFSTDPFVAMLWGHGSKRFQTVYADRENTRYIAAFEKLSIAHAAVVTRIEENLVFEGVVQATRRNLALTGAVLFLSILFIWFFSKTISGPARTLASAAVRIEQGEFEVRLMPKTRDELGLMTRSFGKMSSALAIFGRFTNRDIAVRAMRGEIKPGGLPKHATIFFSDIRGFTEKSENFTRAFGDDASNRIIQWLNAYFTRMVECVEKTGGVVDKFIGDAVMAHWGTAFTAGSPAADARNGVKAALMMREALYEINSRRKPGDPGDPEIRIGCGLNTGIVTAGQLGSEQRMEYTVIGDPVNLASRTEALNKPLGTDILITEDTWNFVGDDFITEEMPPVRVKGKEKPVRMFAVVNLKGASGPQSLAEVRAMLGIAPPDLGAVDVNSEEKKYKIGE